MKNILFLIVIISLFLSCKDANFNKGSNNIYHNNQEINYDNIDDLIRDYQSFELQYNQIFQKELQIKSQEYYGNVTETFIDEETGFFKLFGELWDKPFISKNEKQILWKLKIERYFRTTAYLTHIRNEVTAYTDGVNNQRNNGISKILETNHSSNLKIPIVDANSFSTKNETIKNIINKINKEIIDQLADAVLGFTVEIVLGILGIFGILKGFTIHWSVPIVIFVLLGGIFFWRSHSRQDEIRNILKTECNKALNSTKIDYLDQLNKNTINYYSQLQKINYETNK